MTSPALSDRTRRILAALIREYIESGEPVASAALTRRAGVSVSSATIRNVLAQLE
jgi:heat-inducible transcriptional repressor